MTTTKSGPARRFLSRLLSWLITAPLLLLMILFAVSNRQDVTLQLWPLPIEVILPLSLLLLGLMFGALLIGMFLGWLGQRHTRAEARANRREITRLQSLIAKAPAVTTNGTTTSHVSTATMMAVDPHFKDSL